MNKLLWVCLAFALATVASGQPKAQPLFKDQCDNLMECLPYLAGIIASSSCATVQWELVSSYTNVHTGLGLPISFQTVMSGSYHIQRFLIGFEYRRYA